MPRLARPGEERRSRWNTVAADRCALQRVCLTYGSGPTLVLTAREASGTRSIAVIALQDIYGKIQVLWHSITDDSIWM